MDLTARYPLNGHIPQEVRQPQTVEEVAEVLREAARSGWAVVPWGSGAHQGIGHAPTRYDLALDLTRLSRVLRHRPANLTIRVEAGMRLADLNAMLAEHGQWLPLDPPFGERATIGGILATGLSGPLRARYGSARDLLIGIRVALADGTLIQGGGEVVKNVAGYDLPKLFHGSLGTLGVMVEAAFKLWPRPKAEATWAFGFSRMEDALPLTLSMLRHPGFPLAVEVLNARAWEMLRGTLELPEDPGARVWVLVRAGGWPAQVERIGRDAAAAASGAQVKDRLTEETASLLWSRIPDIGFLPSPAPRDGMSVRLGLLPSQLAEGAAALEAAEEIRVVWRAHGTLGLIYAEGRGPMEALLQWADALRSFALAQGGHFTILGGPESAKRAMGLWAPLRPEAEVMRRIKAQLDPEGRLNPGRFGWA
ncbi:MAG: FAD-binding oxidoreductase [Thermoflexus sp.]|uniref:FAD-binding oxidoreductase n=1 Tax=Thermoflexus sp. TaxID=1969742 RepID=UPI0025F51E77|nr:FAD-binding oxidoreductase [Thermoflexus sp.]MCS6963815.1 FAD-binding oxidoreductase [Thermoflexus sp.]MDW8184743.1 FAD-binding oxidoreductase [Anaerolineae bacterium]